MSPVRASILCLAMLLLGCQGTVQPLVELLSFAESDCWSCVRNVCKDQLAACEANSDCALYYACLLRCPASLGGDTVPGCEEACPRPQDSVAEKAVAALTACRSAGVAAQTCLECHRPTEACLQYRPELLCQQCPARPSTDPCELCDFSNCCQSDRACDDDAGCQGLRACTARCQYPEDAAGLDKWLDCNDFCRNRFPAGVGKMLAWTTCYGSACSQCDPEEPLSLCETCISGDCEKSGVNCDSDPDCGSLDICAALCVKFTNDYDGCLNKCRVRYPRGTLAWNRVQLCRQEQCAPLCAHALMAPMNALRAKARLLSKSWEHLLTAGQSTPR